MLLRLVDPEMPVIAAVSGPASDHSEYALLADIVIAADTTVFSDFPTCPSASSPAMAARPAPAGVRRPPRPCARAARP
ncbi:hypothetical protein ACIQJT_37695 [Streptomyces sp. NPDC091972]|uniref:hypothetical protein n=1 Tax=Streptomyces sp. NPDC091972 TaxID=3366007 RepID=UPI0038050D02